jgi:hypothetical protein
MSFGPSFLMTTGCSEFICSTASQSAGLYWLIQKSVEQRSRIRRLKVRETEYIPLVKLTPMALETDRRDLTNRVRPIVR